MSIIEQADESLVAGRERIFMTLSMIRLLFVIAGLYDFIIGLTFLFFGPQLYDLNEIPYPNHWGYVQFAALMLIIFGIMFFTVAYDPAGNRNLMIYGMLLKLSYTSLVAYYWITVDCPLLFKPFAVIDGLMFLLFLLAYGKCAALSQSSSKTT